jgi:diketogulonate reductase-like aldo/keto reductase
LCDKDFELLNKARIPPLGFGTAKLENSKNSVEVILNAIHTGYRLIDTASAYNNEVSIGKAIKKISPDIPRSELFISSKVSNAERSSSIEKGGGYNETLKAFDNTINRLGLEYIDLYLIHWPVPRYFEMNYQSLNIETWLAMEKLYNDGKIRAIGVCNFLSRHLEFLIPYISIQPMINQIEIHPQYQEKELVAYCQAKGIIVEGYATLQRGGVFKIPLINEIAKKYKRTVSQICIRWSHQRNILPIVKTSSIARMNENIDIFNFQIDEEDMEKIKSLDTDYAHEQHWSYIRQLEN